MGKASVCRFCGRPFITWTGGTCCKNCKDKEDLEFQAIVDYLKKYPNSNAIQIAEGMEISPFDVIRYIDEGRLTISKGSFKSV